MNQKTIGIFTNFMDFKPSYSVSSIVVDQAHMLARHGHKVVILVNEQYNDSYETDVGITSLKERFPDSIKIENITKFLHLIDYKKDDLSDDHKKEIKSGADIFVKSIVDNNIQVIFTHDFIFTGWNLPYYHMIKESSAILKEIEPDLKWLHWIHSVPVFQAKKDWWTLEPLGENHSIVFPNKSESQLVSECYDCEIRKVKVIPHIKDIRNWYEFSQDSRDFIDQYPDIMDAEVIQVYPASTDRLQAKQLDIVLRLFGLMKSKKIPVFLVIANQWATTSQHKEGIEQWIDFGKACGLEYGKDFAFTSISDQKHSAGISKRMLRELQLLSNLFIFPTMEESFGLVGPESVFSGALPITNRSLTMMQEVMSIHCPSFNFGSFNQNHDNNMAYLNAVSIAILKRLYQQESIMAKVYCRVKYHMENIYRRYYLFNIY